MRRSQCRDVAEAVILCGTATVDDLQPHFQRVSKRELIKLLHNAAQSGHIRVHTKGRGPNSPTIWEAGRVALEVPPKVASVWELACPRDPSEWPKEPAVRTVYRPLGDWSAELEGAHA